MICITFIVPGVPIPMPRARVVRLRNGASHAFTPGEATAAKSRVLAAARLAGVPFFVGPVKMTVDAHLDPNGITYWKRGSGDVDNYFKLVADALEGEAYGNDACIVEAVPRKFQGGSPRLVVTIIGTPGPRPAPKPKKKRTPRGLTPAVYRGTKP